MSDIRVRTTTSNVSVRVGQENAIKVLSSAAGGDDFSTNSENSINVLGGIGSITQLNVSGVSTLNYANINSGIASLSNLYVSGITTVSSLNVVGVSTFIGLSTFNSASFYNDASFYGDVNFYSSIYYDSANTYGISYFDSNNYIVSTESSLNPSLTESNLILTTNESGVPSWSNAIDGGTY